MKEKLKLLFSRDRINTGRQPELDFMKAYCIIMMMITHSIDELYVGYSAHLPSKIIDNVLAQSIGAQAFMISMGIGIVFTKKNTPGRFAKRGLYILVTGQLLNLVRYALISGIYFVISGGDLWAKSMMFLTFSVDILQFAGLFFLCMALFSKLKLKSIHIFLISVAANLIGMLLGGNIATGSYAFDQFIGFFIFTETESYFPLFHWMVYPAFGLLFGDILQHVKNKNVFYGALFFPCAIVMAVYYYIGINFEQPFFTVFNDWVTMCHPGIFDVLMQLIANTAVLCLCYFISILLTEPVMKIVNFISKNINRYYCIHLVIIAAFAISLDIRELPYLNTPGQTYLFALVLMIITTVCILVYDRFLLKALRRASKGRGGDIFAVIIMVLSAVIAIWAYQGIDCYTNMINDYTI